MPSSLNRTLLKLYRIVLKNGYTVNTINPSSHGETKNSPTHRFLPDNFLFFSIVIPLSDNFCRLTGDLLIPVFPAGIRIVNHNCCSAFVFHHYNTVGGNRSFGYGPAPDL